MFHLTSASEIFVLCPPALATGGPESLHLLAKTLRRRGMNAKLVYQPRHEHPTPDAYLEPSLAVADKVVDAPDNLLVVPEIWPHHLDRFPRIQKAVWWLSVDNYLRTDPRMPFDFAGSKARGIVHLVGSEYARQFLASRGIEDGVACSSFVNRRFVQSSDEMPRATHVLFNPKKTSPLLERLMRLDPQIEWKPIAGLDRDGVAHLLVHSRVYVDFGPHPGKERLPREAALSRCCVITGRRGSAGNDIDVPIPSAYKLEDRSEPTDAELAAMLDTIRSCVTSYDERIADFAPYREHLVAEEARFENAVAAIFGEPP